MATMGERFNAKQTEIKGKVCVGCHTEPRVVVWRSVPAVRCECKREGGINVAIMTRPEPVVEGRYRTMTNQQLDRQGRNYEIVPTDHGEVKMDTKVVRDFFCSDATNVEAFMFIMAAKSLRLNPYLREIYLIRYQKGAAASVVIGKDAYFGALEREPMANGIESGIVVENGGDEIYRDGSRLRKDDVLIGGWAKVYRKDRSFPVTEDVGLKDWARPGKGSNYWDRTPAHMIQKVAEVHALKKAFPGFLKKDASNANIEIEGVTVDAIEADPLEQPVLDSPESIDEPSDDFNVNNPEFTDRGHFLGMAQLHLKYGVADVLAFLSLENVGDIKGEKDFKDHWTVLMSRWAKDNETSAPE